LVVVVVEVFCAGRVQEEDDAKSWVDVRKYENIKVKVIPLREDGDVQRRENVDGRSILD
jgi:hypothetical protein